MADSSTVTLTIKSLEAQQQIELRELTGGRLMARIFVAQPGDYTLPVAHIPGGAYLLLLRENGRVVDRQRLIIQH